ncbi:unnamed protein product [Caenorhabditis sp. 36 PRJEB53466]|nr:unnamed protein product [Caenorhabditis sp. 36 PRJEB53466]
MPLDYQSEDATTSSRNGIPNGALTVLIIAAIAIVSVVITLFCMLVNNRRSARIRQRTQRQSAPAVLRLSQPSALSSPTDAVRPANYPPLYIVSPSYDPKFDAPPSYEDAVRAMVQNGSNGQISVLATPNINETVITIPEHTPSTSSIADPEAAAQIDVEMTHAHLPTTSTAVTV